MPGNWPSASYDLWAETCEEQQWDQHHAGEGEDPPEGDAERRGQSRGGVRRIHGGLTREGFSFREGFTAYSMLFLRDHVKPTRSAGNKREIEDPLELLGYLGVLVSDTPQAAEMPQNSPFTGILPADERRAVLESFRMHWQAGYPR